MPAALGGILSVWAAAIAGIDLRWRRVPNALLLAVFLPALAWLAWHGRGLLQATPLQSGAGLLIAGLPLLPGYALGYLGAGDVKFAGVLGFMLGALGALELLLVGAAALGLCSAAVLAWRGRGRQGPEHIPACPAFAAAFVLQLGFGRLLV